VVVARVGGRGLVMTAWDAQPLAGARALVIGGGGVGNGRGISRSVAAAGAELVVADRDRARAEECVDELVASGAKAYASVADVLVDGDVERMVADATDRLGGLDTIITNVGGYSLFAEWTPLAEVTTELWQRIMDLNLTYVYRAVRAALPRLLANENGGAIVSVGSISGLVGSPGAAAYGAAKAGLVSLAKTVSVEYAAHGVRMNVVSCGVIATEAQAGVFPEGGGIAERVPAKRPGRPEEIAAAVVFLASPAASYIGGQNLVADGSLSARFPLPLPGMDSSVAG
jgi:3-oxoacyl-[acyl-carrier protein] reductase